MVKQTQKKKNNQRCPKCRNTLINNYGIYTCISCGFEKTNNAERHKFFEVNKEEILKDVATIGRPRTGKKWRILSSSMPKLLKRWQPKEETLSPISSHREKQNGYRPTFPEFSNSWDPEVQKRWLDIFELLVVKGDSHE